MKPKNKTIGLIVAGLCSVALGYTITDAFMPAQTKDTMEQSTAQVPKEKTTNEDNKKEEPIAPADSSVSADTTSIVIDEPVAKKGKMALRATTPVKAANGTYSVVVIADNIPDGCSVVYELFNGNGSKRLASSNTGRFTGVVAEGAKCVALAKAMRGGKVQQKAWKMINGFSGTTNQGNRLSTGEIQALINSRSAKLLGVGAHPLVANHVALSFTNLKSGDPKPQVIGDIYTKIKMNQWLGVSVVGVGYDSNNKVNSITFTINYPASDD